MQLSAAVLVLAATVVAAVAFRWRLVSQRAGLRSWRIFARRRGLRVDGRGLPQDLVLHGRYQGVPVRLWLRRKKFLLGPGLATAIRAEVDGSLPAGLRIATRVPGGRLHPKKKGIDPVRCGHKDLDMLYEFWSLDEARLRQVVNDNLVASALIGAVRTGHALVITEDKVTLERRGILSAELDQSTMLAAGLATVLAEVHQRPWAELAKAHNLLHAARGKGGERMLRGLMRGQTLTIRCSGPRVNPPGPPMSTIRVSFEGGQSSGLYMCRRPVGVGGGSATRDEILDQLLLVRLAEGANDASFLATPDLRARLLQHYREYPGTVVEMGQVVAHFEGMLGEELRDRVEELVSLAMALQEVCIRYQRAMA